MLKVGNFINLNLSLVAIMNADDSDYNNIFNLIKKHLLLILFVFMLLMSLDIVVTLTLPKTYSTSATLILGERDNADREAAIINSYIESSIGLKYNAVFDVYSNKNAKTLVITTESKSPAIAKSAANELMDYYLQYANKTRLKVANDTMKDLQAEINNRKNELVVLYGKSRAYQGKGNLTKEEEKTYAAIQNDISSKEKILSALPYKQAEALKLAYENIRSISYMPAQMPQSFSKPNILFNLIFGIFVSLFIALLAAEIKESIKDNLTSKSHFENTLGTRVLAQIPTSKLSEYFSDNFTEPIKSLNTYLRKIFLGNKIIYVTAPMPSSGTTTVALNMAIEMAKHGKKVLLVDGNLGKPALNKVFSKDGALGYIDFLTNHSQISITGTTQDNLFVMLSGTHVKSYRELLTDLKIKETFKELKKKNFDYILIDGINLSHSEARNFASNADGVLLVTDSQVKKKELFEAKTILSKLKANLIGIVLNKYDN